MREHSRISHYFPNGPSPKENNILEVIIATPACKLLIEITFSSADLRLLVLESLDDIRDLPQIQALTIFKGIRYSARRNAFILKWSKTVCVERNCWRVLSFPHPKALNLKIILRRQSMGIMVFTVTDQHTITDLLPHCFTPTLQNCDFASRIWIHLRNWNQTRPRLHLVIISLWTRANFLRGRKFEKRCWRTLSANSSSESAPGKLLLTIRRPSQTSLGATRSLTP